MRRGRHINLEGFTKGVNIDGLKNRVHIEGLTKGYGKIEAYGLKESGKKRVVDIVIAPTLEDAADQEYVVVVKRKAEYRKPTFA